MSIKLRHPKFLWTAGAGLILCILNPWIMPSLSSELSQEIINLFGMGISLCSLIICFSAFNQARLLEQGQRTHNGQYIASVFFAAGFLELLLFIHYSGITFRNGLLVDSSDVILIVFLTRLLCVMGMLYLGFSSPKSQERPIHKSIGLCAALLYMAVLLLLLQNNDNLDYIFSIYDPLNEIVNPIHYVIHIALFIFSNAGSFGAAIFKSKTSNECEQEPQTWYDILHC